MTTVTVITLTNFNCFCIFIIFMYFVLSYFNCLIRNARKKSASLVQFVLPCWRKLLRIYRNSLSDPVWLLQFVIIKERKLFYRYLHSSFLFVNFASLVPTQGFFVMTNLYFQENWIEYSNVISTGFLAH